MMVCMVFIAFRSLRHCDSILIACSYSIQTSWRDAIGHAYLFFFIKWSGFYVVLLLRVRSRDSFQTNQTKVYIFNWSKKKIRSFVPFDDYESFSTWNGKEIWIFLHFFEFCIIFCFCGWIDFGINEPPLCFSY